MRFLNPSHLVAAALGLALGCGAENQYVYAPEGATSMMNGRPVTRVAVPPEQPTGEVRVESFGIAKLDVGGEAVGAVHVRMIVGNDADQSPWVIDSRQQLLEIPGEGRSRPIYANSDRDGLPILQIARRDRRIIDLYYPLPATIHNSSDLRGFDLLWEVRTPNRVVAQRTPFGRISTEPEVAYSVSAWGPYWWNDPFYSDYTFFHSRPVVGIRGGFHGGFHTGGHRR